MSRDVLVGIEITCDGDDCNETIIIRSNDVTLYPNIELYRAIKEAEEKGWQCIGDKDYCPICITER